MKPAQLLSEFVAQATLLQPNQLSGQLHEDDARLRIQLRQAPPLITTTATHPYVWDTPRIHELTTRTQPLRVALNQSHPYQSEQEYQYSSKQQLLQQLQHRHYRQGVVDDTASTALDAVFKVDHAFSRPSFIAGDDLQIAAFDSNSLLQHLLSVVRVVEDGC